ncbi:MAG: hypothetical protein JXX29_14830 [Deltaproteobacteria bacterium]|nr:hypothetical protein [Deltaproteobacteria bacterium]MBN2672955.1 hypothetical protein [Deltaproteobacteria bacterium]
MTRWILFLSLLAAVGAPALVRAQSDHIERLEKLVEQAQSIPNARPINPAFLDYIERLKAGDQAFYTGETMPHATGYVPSLFAKPSLEAEESPILRKAPLPAQFDLRPDGVTPAKNQGQCGSCWAFASIGSLESSIKLATGEEMDLSENHLKNSLLPESDPCDGGNTFNVAYYTSRGIGPVLESDDPYVPDSTDSSPSGLSPARLVTEFVELPFYRNEVTRDEVKQMIMTYGAVTSSLYFDQVGDSYNESTNSYYYAGEFSEETNHAVLLVGWDDNYAASNFSTPPAGDGAWIAKNSWGEEWGDNGFYYLSYYDSIVGFEALAFSKSVAPETVDDVYELAQDGWLSSWGDGDEDFGAITITARNDAYLKGIGIDIFGANTRYAVTVYKNQIEGDHLSGDAQPTMEGTFSYAGYSTVDLGDLPITAGEIVTIVVETHTASYEDVSLGTIRVPSVPTMWLYDESESLQWTPGQSYFSNDGVTWTDFAELGDETSGMHIAYRVFAGDEPGGMEDPADDTDNSDDTENDDDPDNTNGETDTDGETYGDPDEGCGCTTLGNQTETTGLLTLLFGI